MFAYPRHGTERDVENLQSTFGQLGFDCEVHEDKTSAEMLNIFIEGVQLPHPRIFMSLSIAVTGHKHAGQMRADNYA